MSEKVLKYCFWWPIKTLDTYEADTPPVMQIARNIYATLVSDYIDGKPEGILAKSWSVSPDGKEWRFNLKTDLKFDDGSQITPEIVLLNFKRILWLTRDEGLVLNSLLPEVKTWNSMREVSKVIFIENSNELVFKFAKRPLSLFEAISQPIYGIAHPKCFDEGGKWKEAFCAISSGQYKIDKITDSRILLHSRNVFTKVEKSPQLVEISWPNERSTSVISLLSQKKIDLTVEHSFAIGQDKLKDLQVNGVQIIEEPPLRMHFVHLNYKRAPFSNKDLRIAFQNEFLKSISKNKDFLASGSEVDFSFIPKGGVGYTKMDLAKNLQVIKNKTKKKVEVLFYPFSSDQKIQKSVESSIISTLENLGLVADITYYPDRFEAFNRMRRDDFDLIVRGTGILVHNPYGDLRMMFLSALGAKIPDPSNKISSLILKAEDEQDSEKRALLVTEINKTIFSEAAIITFAHSRLLYLMNEDLNFKRYNLFADPIEFRAIGWKK